MNKANTPQPPQPPQPLHTVMQALAAKDQAIAISCLLEHLATLEPGTAESLFADEELFTDICKNIRNQTIQERNRKKVRVGEPPELADAILRHVNDASPKSHIINTLLTYGLPETIKHIKQATQWSDEDVLGMGRKLLALHYSRILEAVEDWQDDAILSTTVGAVQKIFLEEGWLKKGVNDNLMKLIRKGRSWTSHEADRYFKERFWPDWAARQYSVKMAEELVKKEYSEDRVSLAERISEEGWNEVVFEYSYKGKDAEIFLVLAELLGDKFKNLTIPLPPKPWSAQDIEHLRNSSEHDKGKKLWTQHLAGQLLDRAKTKPGIAWDEIALSLGYTSIVKGTKWINGNVNTQLKDSWQHVQEVAFPNNMETPHLQMLAEGAWLLACPLPLLEAHLQTQPFKRKDTEYQDYIAHHCWMRMHNEAMASPDVTVSTPALSTQFWNSLLAVVQDEKKSAQTFNDRTVG